MKYHKFEVTFRTWNVKSAVVFAEDVDDAIDAAAALVIWDEGEDYEVQDIVQVYDRDGDYQDE